MIDSNQKKIINPFNQAVNAFCNSLIAEEKPLYQSQLEPFTIYAEKLRSSITDSLNMYYNSFQKGYRLVLEQIANKKSSEEQEKYHIPGKQQKAIQTLEDFSENLEHKQVLQSLFEYSGQMMSEVYELGIRLRQEKKLEESASIFIFLVTLNPYICSFWQGLGKVSHELQRFEEALNAYFISINCDPYQIGSYRDAVRCCLDNKNYEEAITVLDHGLKAIEIAEEEESLKDFSQNILVMRAYVESLKREGQS